MKRIKRALPVLLLLSIPFILVFSIGNGLATADPGEVSEDPIEESVVDPYAEYRGRIDLSYMADMPVDTVIAPYKTGVVKTQPVPEGVFAYSIEEYQAIADRLNREFGSQIELPDEGVCELFGQPGMDLTIPPEAFEKEMLDILVIMTERQAEEKAKEELFKLENPDAVWEGISHSTIVPYKQGLSPAEQAALWDLDGTQNRASNSNSFTEEEEPSITRTVYPALGILTTPGVQGRLYRSISDASGSWKFVGSITDCTAHHDPCLGYPEYRAYDNDTTLLNTNQTCRVKYFCILYNQAGYPTGTATMTMDFQAFSTVFYGGWKWIDNKWYYIYSNGEVAVQWNYLDGYWYFWNNIGQMQTGWITWNGYKYYLRPATNTPSPGPEGSMVTGWQMIGGYWYYFMPGNDGSMVTNTVIADSGGYCYMKANGQAARSEYVFVVPWNQTRYVDANYHII